MRQPQQAQDKRCASLRFPPVTCTSMATTPRTQGRRPPKLCKHSTGQARVVIAGKTYYCGRWGSAESYLRHAELIREWQERDGAPPPKAPNVVQASTTVGDLLDRHLEHIDATGRYRKNGEPTRTRAWIVAIGKAFRAFAGSMPVSRCTEATLVAFRDQLERNQEITRRGINRKITTLLQVFRWGRVRGLVQKTVWADVSTIEPLKRGEVGDRAEHGRARRAVTPEEVQRIVAHCCPQVAAMLQLQVMCGMRPGEVLAMRWADIQKTGFDGSESGAWLYVVPGGGKTGHHGHVTRYFLMKAAQQILERFPATPLAAIFSPAVAMAERRKKLRAARKSSVQPSQRERDRAAQHDYADSWGINEYRRHILRACELAGIKPFTPHEVRHGFVTWAANTLGLGAAAAAANHRNVTTTQRYVHVAPIDALAVAAAAQARAERSASG